jgi:hypothetical protein
MTSPCFDLQFRGQPRGPAKPTSLITMAWTIPKTKTQSFHSYTTNQHYSSTSNLLYGGTTQIALRPSSHRTLASVADPTGLGRWVWTLFAGKNNSKLWIISGYRPNPDSSNKTGSVYSQHERYLWSIKDNRNPHRAFVKDLQADLKKWSDKGNQFIIGLDANGNVRTIDINCMMRQAGLVDIHHLRHPHLSTTATCNTNTQDIPVYGIWGSLTLDCVTARYYGSGELLMGKTDHRMIWADFLCESAFGLIPESKPYTIWGIHYVE